MSTKYEFIMKLRKKIKNIFVFSYFLVFRSQEGYAALTLTIITVMASLTIIGGFTFFAFQEVNTNRAFTKSIESHYISEGGIEDAVYRIAAGKQIGSSETLTVGSGVATIL
ncbi:MAG: hypothetical protein HYW91_02485, partial [Candidatus Sungbacteria bacterium]|nr:hypothetical protein [Candidatus Sungbacteria bacterium]